MERFQSFCRGFGNSVPLGISAFLYGLAYGVLAYQAHLSAGVALAMSMLIFAGASQLTAVQMIGSGIDPLPIVVTVFIINLRHYLMAASLAPYLRGYPRAARMLGAFFLTDESYAATYSHFQTQRPTIQYFLGSGICLFCFWCAATLAGYYGGNFIPARWSSILDFAFVAAFIGMLVPLVRNGPVVLTVVTAALVSVLGSIYLPGKWYIVIAALIASAVGYLAERRGVKPEASRQAACSNTDRTGAVDEAGWG
ncbi:4-azaleucine resistance transporter AzlC [Hydrogenispora ethanolica]|uniref:4-azaleucine resistance transporter AzlC n=1 Tax=Hydrogenispora ethanolica TaxID=1082276 RepID=A0A4R1RMA9_HYDET|nr:AzlC family ABC transporter permease [Hydrogenispora ethanolica]TCL67398.1 4-azaleucine resistance transporter AzlC [Hydrogenispora ethanolica]